MIDSQVGGENHRHFHVLTPNSAFHGDPHL